MVVGVSGAAVISGIWWSASASRCSGARPAASGRRLAGSGFADSRLADSSPEVGQDCGSVDRWATGATVAPTPASSTSASRETRSAGRSATCGCATVGPVLWRSWGQRRAQSDSPGGCGTGRRLDRASGRGSTGAGPRARGDALHRRVVGEEARRRGVLGDGGPLGFATGDERRTVSRRRRRGRRCRPLGPAPIPRDRRLLGQAGHRHAETAGDESGDGRIGRPGGPTAAPALDLRHVAGCLWRIVGERVRSWSFVGGRRVVGCEPAVVGEVTGCRRPHGIRCTCGLGGRGGIRNSLHTTRLRGRCAGNLVGRPQCQVRRDRALHRRPGCTVVDRDRSRGCAIVEEVTHGSRATSAPSRVGSEATNAGRNAAGAASEICRCSGGRNAQPAGATARAAASRRGIRCARLAFAATATAPLSALRSAEC